MRYTDKSALFASLAVLFINLSPASAEPIDLSKPYGNTAGCINRDGQEEYSEDMRLLTATELVTSASACEITKTEANADGSLKLSMMCDSEGEEEPDPTFFTVTRGKTPGTLEITDSDGFLFGEVALCK